MAKKNGVSVNSISIIIIYFSLDQYANYFQADMTGGAWLGLVAGMGETLSYAFYLARQKKVDENAFRLEYSMRDHEEELKKPQLLGEHTYELPSLAEKLVGDQNFNFFNEHVSVYRPL